MRHNSFISYCLLLLTVLLIHPAAASGQKSSPLRLGVAGLSHGHINEVLRRVERGDFTIVGIAEKDESLRRNNALAKKVDQSVLYADLNKMLDETKPEVVVAYGSIYEHLQVVEACAPRKIHVMVEKPLAVNTQHANRMAQLARENNIFLLTNYETTWYNTNHEAFRLIQEEKAIGEITRINVYDGHQGPVEIRCGPEFLQWLTDPVLNGGGAVIDFGCYGANLSVWLMNGKKPVSVYAVLKQQKPAIYPKVDDDATIILEYSNAVVQIMASWNWPMGRKDMHIYGSKGYIYQDTPNSMRVYTDNKETTVTAPKLQAPYDDSFFYLKAVIQGDIKITPTDLSSLENNLIVVEILNAAIESSRTGKIVKLDQ